MIIFGTRTLNSTKSHGNFHCPRCSMPRSYQHRSANRWFTLYFIPCIPMGSAGEFIECGSCGGTYGVEVLSYNPALESSQTAHEVRRIVVLAMIAARRSQPENIATLQDVFFQLFDESPTEDDIRQDAQMAQQAGAQLAPFIQQASAEFNNDGKVMLLKICAQVFAGQGQLMPTDREVLNQMATAMDIAPVAMQQLLENEQQLLGRE